MTINEIADAISKQYALAVEAQLIEAFEKHLGRVPTNAEVALHAKKFEHSSDLNLTEFYWDQTFLFGIQQDGISFGRYESSPRLQRHAPE